MFFWNNLNNGQDKYKSFDNKRRLMTTESYLYCQVNINRSMKKTKENEFGTSEKRGKDSSEEEDEEQWEIFLTTHFAS